GHRCLVTRIAVGAPPGPPRENDAGTRSCTEDDVLRLRRAVDEIPRLEFALLPFDDPKTLAAQDEKAFLPRLLVVHRHRHARRQDVQVDPQLLEPRVALALEPAVVAQLVVRPAGVAGVDDEPPLGLRNTVLELRLLNHARKYARRRAGRGADPGAR